MEARVLRGDERAERRKKMRLNTVSGDLLYSTCTRAVFMLHQLSWLAGWLVGCRLWKITRETAAG
jgi:hypothetical protein